MPLLLVFPPLAVVIDVELDDGVEIIVTVLGRVLDGALDKMLLLVDDVDLEISVGVDVLEL